MKREDVAIRDNASSPAARDLINKVDEALRTETKRFFNKTTSQNIKRWMALQQSFDRERDGGQPACAVGVKSSHGITAADLDAEERRLEQEYNKNWLKHEGFSLRAAFKSQAARVDADWAQHEQSLTDDYQSRRAQLLGSSVSSFGSPERMDKQDSRWQHPEKQKTLIHTAPVLSPSTQATKAESTSRKSRGGDDNSAEVNKGAIYIVLFSLITLTISL